MSAKNKVGIALIALPFAVVFATCAAIMSVKFAVAIFALAAAVIVCVGLGSWLLDK